MSVFVVCMQSRDRKLVLVEMSRDWGRWRFDARRPLKRWSDDCRLLFLRGAHTLPYNTCQPTSDSWTVQAFVNQERLLEVFSCYRIFTEPSWSSNIGFPSNFVVKINVQNEAATFHRKPTDYGLSRFHIQCTRHTTEYTIWDYAGQTIFDRPNLYSLKYIGSKHKENNRDLTK